MTRRLQVAITLAFLLAAGVGAAGDDLSLQELPDPVRKTVLSETEGGDILDVERDTDAGEVLYEIEFILDGTRYELDVAPDGTLVQRHRD